MGKTSAINSNSNIDYKPETPPNLQSNKSDDKQSITTIARHSLKTRQSDQSTHLKKNNKIANFTAETKYIFYKKSAQKELQSIQQELLKYTEKLHQLELKGTKLSKLDDDDYKKLEFIIGEWRLDTQEQLKETILHLLRRFKNSDIEGRDEIVLMLCGLEQWCQHLETSLDKMIIEIGQLEPLNQVRNELESLFAFVNKELFYLEKRVVALNIHETPFPLPPSSKWTKFAKKHQLDSNDDRDEKKQRMSQRIVNAFLSGMTLMQEVITASYMMDAGAGHHKWRVNNPETDYDHASVELEVTEVDPNLYSPTNAIEFRPLLELGAEAISSENLNVLPILSESDEDSDTKQVDRDLRGAELGVANKIVDHGIIEIFKRSIASELQTPYITCCVFYLASRCLELFDKKLEDRQTLAIQTLLNSWEIKEDVMGLSLGNFFQEIFSDYFATYIIQFQRDQPQHSNSTETALIVQALQGLRPGLMELKVEGVFKGIANQYDAFIKGKPVLITTGYDLFRITVLLFGNFLVIANKNGTKRGPLEVFRINQEDIKPEQIELIYSFILNNPTDYIHWVKDIRAKYSKDIITQYIEKNYPFEQVQINHESTWKSLETALYAIYLINAINPVVEANMDSETLPETMDGISALLDPTAQTVNEKFNLLMQSIKLATLEAFLDDVLEPAKKKALDSELLEIKRTLYLVSFEASKIRWSARNQKIYDSLRGRIHDSFKSSINGPSPMLSQAANYLYIFRKYLEAAFPRSLVRNNLYQQRRLSTISEILIKKLLKYSQRQKVKAFLDNSPEKLLNLNRSFYSVS